MTDAEFLSARRFDDTEAWAVHNGSMEWTPTGFAGGGQDWCIDETPLAADGRAVLGINGLITRSGDAIVVVDPNELDPAEPMGAATLHVGSSVSDALSALGIDAADVTHVPITHGHADHFSAVLRDGKPRFPNAEYVFPAADWRFFVEENGHGTAATLRHHLEPIRRTGRLRLVEGDEAVAPGVEMLDTPGESPGHHVVRLSAGEERLYYLGDLVHFPAEIRHIDWIGVTNRDAEQLEQSRRRVFADAAESGATVVYTHGRFPAWGAIARADGGYRWRWDD